MAKSAINISANAQEVINLRKRIEELKSTLSSMRRSTDPAAYDKLNRELHTSSVRYNRLVGDIQRYVVAQQQASKATSSSASELQNLLAKIGGTTAIMALGQQITNVRGEIQQLEIAFETMLGSKEKADAMMANIKQLALSTPFTLTEVADNTKQIIAMGVASEKAIDTVKMLGDVAAGVSVPLWRIAQNYGQVSALGKLQGREIRDFAMAGIPIVEELGKMLNKTSAEIYEMVEAGKIGFPQVEQAFKNMSGEGGKFYNLMEKQNASVTGQISKLQDSLQLMFNEIGQSSEGAIYTAINGASALIDNYETIGEILMNLVATYGLYKAAVIAVPAIQATQMTKVYEAQAVALTKLLNGEQAHRISQMGLVQGSAEHVAAIKAEISATAENLKTRLAEEKANLQSIRIKRAEAEQAMITARAKTEAARQELTSAIATSQAEAEASLLKKMALESEKQSRAALRSVKLQEQKDASIAQATALKEKQASAEKIAAKNREIASIQAKVNAARAEEIQHGRNVAAMRAEIKSGVNITANKNVQTLTSRLNTLSEQENAAATAHNGYIKQMVGSKLLIKKLATDADTASTTANTAVTTANTTATNFLSAAKTRLTLVAKNLWATLAPNPYVLAAAAVVALGYGIYKLATYQTEAEKAQERLNESVSRFRGETVAEQAEIDRLFDKLKNTTKGSANYQKVKDEIISKYGSYLSGLREEVKSLGDVESAYRAISKAARQAAIDRAVSNSIKEAQDSFVESTKGFNADLLKALQHGRSAMSKGAAEAFVETINSELEKTGKLSDETRKKLEKFNEVRNTRGGQVYTLNDPLRIIGGLGYARESLEKQQQEIVRSIGVSINQYENLGKETIDSYIKGFQTALSDYQKSGNKQKIVLADSSIILGSEEEINLHLQKLLDVRKELDSGTEKSTVKNKSYWEKQKEKAESARNALDKAEEGGKEWLRLTNEIAEAEKNIKLYESPTKAGSQAESAVVKAKKIQQELSALQDKLGNEELKRRLESDQKIIDQKDDGFQKQIAQNQLNYKKELQQIKEFEDSKKKERGEAVLKFGANKVPVELSETNIKKQVDNLIIEANSQFEKSNKDLYKSLAEKHQSYADQRLAIEKQFNKDIEALSIMRADALKKGDQSQADLYTRSIAKATSDKGEALMSFDFDRLKESPEYVRAFEDLNNSSSETLNSLLKQLQEAKGVASKILSPAQLREYTSSTQAIIDKLTERNPYQALIESKKGLADAEKELADAQVQFERVRSGAGVITGITEKEGKLTAIYLSEEDALKNVRKALDNYNKKNNDVVKAQKKVLDEVNQLSNALSGLGKSIGGTAGDIIGFMGNIGTFATTSMEGITKVADKSATAISNIEKASVILTIISMAIQLMRELDSLIPDAHDKYKKYDEKIEQINNLRDAVTEYEIAVLKAKQADESWFGEDSLKSLKDAKDLQEKILEAKIKKNNERQATYKNKKSGGWLTSVAQLMTGQWFADKVLGTNLTGNKYEEGTTAAIDNLRIETRKRKKGFLGSGIGGKSQKTENLVDWAKNNLGFDLFDADGWINEEAYDVIMSKYSDKLVGQTKETLEEMKALKEQYNEYQKQLKEYVNSMYKPLVDNMVSAIWDWFDEGKNALDSFKDYASSTFRDIASDMIKTILLDKVFDGYQDKIAGLYEEYSKGNMTEKELSDAIAKETANVVDRYDKTLPMLQDTVNAINKGIKEAAGIDLKEDSKSQQASKGYSTSMSQDTGAAIEGRLTSVQMSNLNIEANTKGIWEQLISEKVHLEALSSPLTSMNDSALRIERLIEESQAIAVSSYYELKDINKNTQELYPMRQDMQAVRRSLENL